MAPFPFQVGTNVTLVLLRMRSRFLCACTVPLTRFVAGISIDVPGLAGAGVYADYDISGDATAITFDISVDLCVDYTFKTVCASSILPGLPVPLLQGTFDFSGLC